MADYRERIVEDEGTFQKLLKYIPGFSGYRQREIRRAADKIIRDRLIEQLDTVRELLQRTIRDKTDEGVILGLDLLDTMLRRLEKVQDRIRYADYGYTGFFSAIKINSDALDRVYDADLGLFELVENARAAVANLADLGQIDRKSGIVKQVQDAVAGLDRKMDQREDVFRGENLEQAE